MEDIKEDASKIGKIIGEDVKRNASTWTEVAEQFIEKITGKGMAVTYEFQDFEIDVPKATGPDGKEIGSATWKINGKFVISTEVQDKGTPME